MPGIDNIVNVTISQQTQAVPQQGFGIPLIMGTSNRFVELIRYYSDVAGMVADGFLVSDPEYIHAVAAFSQALSPTLVGIGKYTVAVAQVDTFAVNTVTASHAYVFTLNGTLISYTAGGGDAQEDILDGLLAAIATAFPTDSPVTGVRTGTAGSALLTLTSATAGVAVAYTLIDSLLTHVALTANHSIVSDIQDLQDVSDVWYGLIIVSKVASDILQVAAYIETQKKIFIAATEDADVPTSATDDVASALKALLYKRTGLIYNTNSEDGPDAAWVGGQLPNIPGSTTWKFKQLVGIATDTFTSTERLNLIGNPIAGVVGKNCNIYETIGGQPITEEGYMSGGQFIDVTIGIDWLESTMQSNVFTNLVQSPKIPYTDAGGAVIENAVRQTLLQGVANGLIDGSSIEVTVPPVLDQTTTDRANRILRGVKFSCRLAGAFHFVVINGVVTV